MSAVLIIPVVRTHSKTSMSYFRLMDPNPSRYLQLIQTFLPRKPDHYETGAVLAARRSRQQARLTTGRCFLPHLILIDFWIHH
jgi:hypothetical protein